LKTGRITGPHALPKALSGFGFLGKRPRIRADFHGSELRKGKSKANPCSSARIRGRFCFASYFG
jgi:hypothetical protein